MKVIKILAHNEYYRSPKRTVKKAKRDFMRGYLVAINEANYFIEKYDRSDVRALLRGLVNYLERDEDVGKGPL